ncbi:hypothetical protein COOONC_00960 [Cooperia oncophora]
MPKWIINTRILDFNKLNSTAYLPRWAAKKKKKIHKVLIPRRRSKRSPHRLVLPKSEFEPLQAKQSEVLPPLFEQTTKSPVHKVTNLFVSLFGKVPVQDLSTKWSTTYKKLVKLAQIFESNEKLPGARVYDTRVYDLVVGNNAPKPSEVFVPPFLTNVFNIVNSFKGSPNARILSPRFVPLMPDKTDAKRILSPSLFPLYKDDTEEQIMPVPKMLETVGLNEKDRKRVLEMVMEVSGAREAVDNAMKILHHLNSFELGEKFLAVSERVGESFERLRNSMSARQKDELNKRGFTFMEKAQMRKLHDEQGCILHIFKAIQYKKKYIIGLNEPEIKSIVEDYGALGEDQREAALWEAIANIAGLNKRQRRRQRRQVTVLAPVVLSPYQFAPVLGLSILGPVVLSPNIFSPLVLNPSVLGPWVLSPAIPLPFVISPYVLSPYVLSPLGLAPFVFSPYVLSPNVINPYVLSPVVLSPVVLCPDVLSPMALGGGVLSPTVLSPSVLSKSYLMASVLSPSFLS